MWHSGQLKVKFEYNKIFSLFVFGVYAIATVFQSYNGGQLTLPHCTWTDLAFLSG